MPNPSIAQWIEKYKETDSDFKKIATFAADNAPEAKADTCLIQGTEMAYTLSTWGCDPLLLQAALLSPFISHNPSLMQKAEKALNPALLKLVKGAAQMEIIHQMNREQAEPLRKMMLAMVDDIRVVILKLAERLYLIKHAQDYPKEMQIRIATETFDYYTPLANRLGMSELKWQLEDGAFHLRHPEDYKKIAVGLQLRKNEREKLINTVIASVETLLKQQHIKNFSISGRAKHFYSIYKKTKRKGVGLEHIFDASAIRVIVPDIEACYTVLSFVHEKWEPIQEEFDDYIAKPKPNGYQSIHTAVLLENKTPLEIQIRTNAMHEMSEQGVAAHWQYKENKAVQEKEAEKILLLRELLDWQNHLSRAQNQTELYQKAFHDRVYVFSPEGEVFDLPQGATPLDFAYLVHTDVGHRCRGAKINNTLVPLTTPLKTGDHIDILTSKENHPSHDWIRPELGYLKTMNAIRKVKAWYRKKDFEINLDKGKALWEKILSQHAFKITALQKLLEGFNLKNTDALLAALGAGDISSSTIIQKLTKPGKTTDDIILAAQNQIEENLQSSPASIQGVKYLLLQLAKCCHPLPGDSIVGYITKNRGISVHKASCNNIQHILEDNPERIMHMDWEGSHQQNYTTRLTITAEDREGLLRDITGLTSQLNLSIASLQSAVNSKAQTATIILSLQVNNSSAVEMITQKLRQIPGVLSIKR